VCNELSYIFRYIMGTLNSEPKNVAPMRNDVNTWVSKRQALKDGHDHIEFQSNYIADLCKATGYNEAVSRVGQMFNDWKHDKMDNITTYRDKCFTSIISGSKAPMLHTPWMQCFDDSIHTFVGK